MSESTASAALSTRLSTLVDLPPVAWMNSPTFTPPMGETWLAEFDMPVSTNELSISLTGSQDKAGMYQVNVMSPLGAYRFTNMQLAESVKALFRGYKDGDLVVHSVQIGKAMRTGDWWMTPVTVDYRVVF